MILVSFHTLVEGSLSGLKVLLGFRGAKMATMKLIVLAAVCACVYAFPDEPTGPITRTTIFGDERLKGEIFENVHDEIEVSRNTDSSAMYRLPTTTRPRHYDVYWQITMNGEQSSLTGSVDIQLYATQPNVSEIVLHADAMQISSVALRQGTNTNTITINHALESTTQFLRVRLSTIELQYNANNPVIYTLSVAFSSPLRNDMYGIYRSWYRNTPSEQISWMASTQFQGTSARYAFPCYDEPSFKATFTITISRQNAYRSWSCTRIRESNASSVAGFTEDRYHTTPVMSTYLLALIVANYESIRYPQTGDLLVEVIARRGAINDGQGAYAFDVGQRLLDQMNNHTAIDFHSVNPNIKMTHAAIPDFSAGAMENWGLLTYREAYLMYSPQHTNSYFKQLIAYILSHEIAHMWFGNLVTNDWWDVLWLNEGFARYYQYFLTHWVEDYMGLETRFITEQVHTALLSDSSNNPHPLSTNNIGSPAQVSDMFSTLSYNKGAAVIRMTEHLLGTDVHTEGLRNYLVDRAFDTALPIDLLRNLQNVSVIRGAISEYGSNFSVIDYYNSWTEQPGHPVLNVQVNHRTGEMTIQQRRFNINTGYSYNNLNYIVPITFATASNPDFENTKPTHIIRNTVTTINRGSIGDEWVVFNKQQTGYYRVNYDDYTWDLIVAQLRRNVSVIHEYNRAQIVNDVFQFARSGMMSYTRAFTILSFLENETEYAPWMAAITGFNWVRNRLIGTNQLQGLHNFIIRMSTLVMSRLTYNQLANETFMQSYLRYQLAPLLCNIGHQPCITAAQQQFRSLVNNNQEVFVDNRNWVYCNGLRGGAQTDYTFLYNRFLNHNVYTEKIQILWILGCTSHRASLEALLNVIVSNNNIVRPQDYINTFSGAVSGNEANTQIVFEYIRNNLAAVTAAFNGPATPLSYVSARLRTRAEVTAFQTWANQTQAQLGDAYTAVYNGAQATLQSIEYYEEIESQFSDYFNNPETPLQSTTSPPVVSTNPTTVTPVPLIQPATPNITETSSAINAAISLVLLFMAAMVNILL